MGINKLQKVKIYLQRWNLKRVDPMKKSGRVAGVCISQKRTDPKKNVGRGSLKKGLGLVSDSHAGTEKEVSLLAIGSIRKLNQDTGISSGPGSFAENITTEGFELTSLPKGKNLCDCWRNPFRFFNT
jgi:MOSC domain-containing protein YiiM